MLFLLLSDVTSIVIFCSQSVTCCFFLVEDYLDRSYSSIKFALSLKLFVKKKIGHTSLLINSLLWFFFVRFKIMFHCLIFCLLFFLEVSKKTKISKQTLKFEVEKNEVSETLILD